MKTNKWLKWKIGAVVSLGLSLLFYEVKSSTAFADKVQASGSAGGGTNSNSAADKGQSDLFAYPSGDGQSSGQASGNTRRGPRHRSGSFSGSGGGENFGPGSGSGSGSDFGSGSNSGSNSGSGSGSYSTPTAPSSPVAPSIGTHTRTGRS